MRARHRVITFVLVRLALWLTGIVSLVGAGAYFAFRRESADTPLVWLGTGVPTLILAVVGLVRARRDGELREWITPRWGDFSIAFVSAGLLFGGAWVVQKALMPVGSPRELWLVSLYGQIGDPRVLQSRAVLVGAAILFLSAAEEITWRGLVRTLLAERFGTRWAWVWAAIPYALAHLPTMFLLRPPGGPLNPVLPLAALGCGLVWGAIAHRTQRLTTSILSHALFDWTVIMMFPLWGPRGL